MLSQRKFDLLGSILLTLVGSFLTGFGGMGLYLHYKINTCAATLIIGFFATVLGAIFATLSASKPE